MSLQFVMPTNFPTIHQQLESQEGTNLAKNSCNGTGLRMSDKIFKRLRRFYMKHLCFEETQRMMKIIPPHPPLIKGGWGDFQVK